MEIILFLQQKQKIARNKIAMTELKFQKVGWVVDFDIEIVNFLSALWSKFIEWDSIIITF